MKLCKSGEVSWWSFAEEMIAGLPEAFERMRKVTILGSNDLWVQVELELCKSVTYLDRETSPDFVFVEILSDERIRIFGFPEVRVHEVPAEGETRLLLQVPCHAESQRGPDIYLTNLRRLSWNMSDCVWVLKDRRETM